MKLKVYLGVLIFILILVLAQAFVNAGEDSETTPTAVADLPLLFRTNQVMLNPKLELNPFPTQEQIQWFDMNRDLKLNEFDWRHFESIIKSMHGEKMSGLQLAIRFRVLQKNQRENFPILYDLDRDGMFTAFDVDRFGGIINQLDAGASRGHQLVERFKIQLSSQN